MADQGDEFSFFQVINITIDIRIDNSISIRPMSTKFDKQVHVRAFTQMTNQAGATDVITSRSREKLKPLYLHYHIAYGHQTWEDGD